MSEQNTTTRRRFPRRLILGGVAVAALLAGGAGVAKAVEKHHHGMWSMDNGVPVEMIEHRADHMLGKVAATPDQTAKVHAIIEAAAKDLNPELAAMKGTHKQLADLLTAPQIDRAAIDKLRADRTAEMEKVSARVSLALEDAADVLTPDQRAKLKGAMGEWEGHKG